MPSLGFLKKKRTKDSQGSNDLNSPTSPTLDRITTAGGTPITPTLSKNSGLVSEPESTTTNTTTNNTAAAAKPPPAPAAEPMNTSQGGQFAGQAASANTQNVPSIRNLVNGPSYSTGTNASSQHSAHDSAYCSTAGSHNAIPSLNIPAQKGASNPVRETKGKYTLTDFQIQRTLGTGSFGRVHLVQSKHNQRYYAIKVLKKAQVVKMKQVEHTNDERRMLQRCKHPFLITLWGTFQDSKNLYMVMDFIEGGELFSLLRKSQVCLPSHTI